MVIASRDQCCPRGGADRRGMECVVTQSFFRNPEHKHTIKGKNVLPAGDHTLVADFDYEGGGVGKGATVTLLLNGEEVAKGNIPATVPTRFSMTEGLDVGRDAGLPLTKDYDVPFRFTGKIGKVVVTLEGEE